QACVGTGARAVVAAKSGRGGGQWCPALRVGFVRHADRQSADISGEANCIPWAPQSDATTEVPRLRYRSSPERKPPKGDRTMNILNTRKLAIAALIGSLSIAPAAFAADTA